jgi:hypothetical protein
MKSVTLFVVALAVAAPARAQHYHDQSSPPPAPQRGGGPQTPPIEVPWNDAIPAGTVDHAARALKESPRLMAAGGAVLREEPEMNLWFDGR